MSPILPRAIVAVAALPADFPFNIEHAIVESLEAITLSTCNMMQELNRCRQHCHGMAGEGKLGAIPLGAIMRGKECLGIASDNLNLFFAWAIEDKAEGILYRSRNRGEDYSISPAWLSWRVSTANFHEGIVGQSAKIFTRMPSDMKKPYEPSRL